MALEALIKTKGDSTSELAKKEGDVICVKLAGSFWGDKEAKVHQVVMWEDAELEEKLIAMKNAGEPTPVLCNPYAVYEVAIDKISNKRTTTIKEVSKERINLSLLPVELLNNIKNPDVKVDILNVSDYTRETKIKWQ